MIRYNNDPPSPAEVIQSLNQQQILEAKRNPYLFWSRYGFKVTIDYKSKYYHRIFSGHKRPMKSIRLNLLFVIHSKSKFRNSGMPYQYAAWLVGSNGNIFIYHLGKNYHERAIHIRKPERISTNEKI